MMACIPALTCLENDPQINPEQLWKVINNVKKPQRLVYEWFQDVLVAFTALRVSGFHTTLIVVLKISLYSRLATLTFPLEAPHRMQEGHPLQNLIVSGCAKKNTK